MEIASNAYFKCATKDGKVLYFNKECNAVDYSRISAAIFMHVETGVGGTQYSEVLAMIPWSNICTITSSKLYQQIC